jgi:putative holliday junction resolvase
MSDLAFPDSGRLMGIDAGERRVGVAVTDELRTIASPVATVVRGKSEAGEFRQLVERYGVEGIVAGLPKGMSGREGQQASDARDYAERLAESLGLPLRYWDERLTTAMAERSLIEAGHSRGKRKEIVDAVAAALMLQSFIDSRVSRRNRRRGE